MAALIKLEAAATIQHGAEHLAGALHPALGRGETQPQVRGNFLNRLEKSMQSEVTTASGGFADGVMSALNASVYNEAGRQIEFNYLEKMTGQMDAAFARADNAKLLGYGRHLRRLSKTMMETSEEYALRLDISTARYFVILRAYDLRTRVNGHPPAVWTVYLNMRSPGHNFPEAVAAIAPYAADYSGRQTDDVQTLDRKLRTGNVEIGNLIIIGEAR